MTMNHVRQNARNSLVAFQITFSIVLMCVINASAITKPIDANTLLFCDTFTVGKSSDWIEEFGEKSTQLFLQDGVCKFHMDYGDPLWQGYARAELHISPTKIDFYRGGHFVHFRQFVPTDFVLDASSEEIINQIHGRTESTWGSPNVTMRINNDKINIQTAVYPNGVNNPIQRQKLYEGAITKGAWVSWVYYFNAAGGSASGKMMAWKNGSLVLDFTGVVSDAYKNNLEWKMGLYKPSWASSASNVNSRDLQYDDIYIWDEVSGSTSVAQPSSRATNGNPVLRDYEVFTIHGRKVGTMNASRLVPYSISNGSRYSKGVYLVKPAGAYKPVERIILK